jgi:hypothetical protein
MHMDYSNLTGGKSSFSRADSLNLPPTQISNLPQIKLIFHLIFSGLGLSRYRNPLTLTWHIPNAKSPTRGRNQSHRRKRHTRQQPAAQTAPNHSQTILWMYWYLYGPKEMAKQVDFALELAVVDC